MTTQTLMRELKRIPRPASLPLTSAGTYSEERIRVHPDCFPAYPDLQLKDGRYTILRKLGQGRFSTTWLVFDSQAPKAPYYAVKILTVNATKEHKRGRLLELKVLEKIKELRGPRTTNLPYLSDYFETKGPYGQHLCLVLPVLSTDISGFMRSAPLQRLGSHTVKVIIAQVLEALATLHGENIMHGDVNPDNVLFVDGTSPKAIKEYLRTDPPSIVRDLDGTRYGPQPIPTHFNWSDPPKLVVLYFVQLVDFGNARWIKSDPAKKTIKDELRAPEVILGASFDTKVDIWALGCMTFQLLTGHLLFSPPGGQAWLAEDDHLAKMTEVMGETFNQDLLLVSPDCNKYFNKEGKLRRRPNWLASSLEDIMEGYGVPAAEMGPAAKFIRACLHLNPQERPSAAVLRAHSWLNKAFVPH